MGYLYFHALEFVKVNNRLTERNVLEIVLMFGAKMGDLLSVFAVAPHAGAWVEMIPVHAVWSADLVAPHAGAWIEILNGRAGRRISYVAPLVGAWIEMLLRGFLAVLQVRRSPCGSVG